PLVAEGIFAFFLESVFIAVLIFGWNRVSVKTLWFSSSMVVVGTTLSAFWIIAVNSWMQTPAGYLMVSGRAELIDFWSAVFNPSTVPRFLHTIDASLITGSFFMLGVSARFILKNSHIQFARDSLKIALIAGFIASVFQLGTGHYHAVQVAFTQPEKLASFEGIFETQKRAPMLLFGIPDEKDETVHAAVKIPGLISMLAFGNIEKEVKGLKDFPKEERPPLALTFYPFHIMVALGIYFIVLTKFGVFLLWKKQLYQNRLFLKLALWSISLPFIANELGWISAEVGRQPWIIYHVLKTSDAVSVSVSAGQVLFSLIIFTLIYLLLLLTWIFLLKREIKKGPEIQITFKRKERTG
ncbi:MAG: cytochrome ubiquinol oxidase subunit I, partial [Fidelibacterota bacterium]